VHSIGSKLAPSLGPASHRRIPSNHGHPERQHHGSSVKSAPSNFPAELCCTNTECRFQSRCRLNRSTHPPLYQKRSIHELPLSALPAARWPCDADLPLPLSFITRNPHDVIMPMPQGGGGGGGGVTACYERITINNDCAAPRAPRSRKLSRIRSKMATSSALCISVSLGCRLFTAA